MQQQPRGHVRLRRRSAADAPPQPPAAQSPRPPGSCQPLLYRVGSAELEEDGGAAEETEEVMEEVAEEQTMDPCAFLRRRRAQTEDAWDWMDDIEHFDPQVRCLRAV